MKVIDGDHLKSILQEYVKREEAYAESGDFFDSLSAIWIAVGLLEAIHSIEEEPPAQLKQKKGKWNHGLCSVCGYDWGKDAPIANVPPYCPNCGADMKGE